MNRKPVFTVFLLCVLALLLACVSTGSGTGLSLQDAIDQSAEKIAKELPAGSRVAIVAFETSDDNLSNYIMEELTGALFDRGIEVADRRNLEYVYREQNFQMSGDVSDETAVSIGKFLGANMVITGQLIDLGDTYRYRTSAIRMEQATRASVTRLNVRGDAETRQMVATIAQQQTVITETKYGVNEEKTPQTAGTYLDRGIMFAMRGDYDMAIEDFTEAIRLDPNSSSAYMQRGKALFAKVHMVTPNNTVNNEFEFVGGYWKPMYTEEEKDFLREAIRDLSISIHLDPSSIAYTYRGIIWLGGGLQFEANRHYTINGDVDQLISEEYSLFDFSEAIRLDPDHAATAYFWRGYRFFELGLTTAFINSYWDQSRADFLQVIRINSDAFAYYHLASMENNLGKNIETIRMYLLEILKNDSIYVSKQWLDNTAKNWLERIK